MSIQHIKNSDFWHLGRFPEKKTVLKETYQYLHFKKETRRLKKEKLYFGLKISLPVQKMQKKRIELWKEKLKPLPPSVHMETAEICIEAKGKCENETL